MITITSLENVEVIITDTIGFAFFSINTIPAFVGSPHEIIFIRYAQHATLARSNLMRGMKRKTSKFRPRAYGSIFIERPKCFTRVFNVGELIPFSYVMDFIQITRISG